MLNHITIMGRLTRDPELRYTQSQIPVASFTLAVDRDIADQSGNRQTDFIDCVAWRKTAEFVQKYFTKGSMAVASGRLQLRDWTDKDGNKRRSAEVVAENVYFGESKKSDGNQSTARTAATPAYGQTAAPAYGQYGQTGGYSGYDQSGYGGGYGAPQFSDLGDTDGELPF